MNKNKISIISNRVPRLIITQAISAIMPLFMVGCGQMVTGTYQGTETVTVRGGTPASHSVTVSITQMSNDEIKGSMTSDRSRGDLAGRPNGAISHGPYTLLTTYNGIPVPSGGLNCGTYTGQGTLTPQQFSIKLDLTQPAAAPTNLPGIATVQDICPTSRVITATRQ